MSIVEKLSKYLLGGLLVDWLPIDELCRLDTSFCSKKNRELFLKFVSHPNQLCWPCMTKGCVELKSYKEWSFTRGVLSRHVALNFGTEHALILFPQFASVLHNISCLVLINLQIAASMDLVCDRPIGQLTSCREISFQNCKIELFPFIVWNILEHLSIDNCEFSPEVLANCNSLTSLTIKSCWDGDDLSKFTSIACQESLRSIYFENISFKTQQHHGLLERFYKCANLTSLRLKSCLQGTDSNVLLVLLSIQFKNLTTLQYENCDYQPNTLRGLFYFPKQLTSITVDYHKDSFNSHSEHCFDSVFVEWHEVSLFHRLEHIVFTSGLVSSKLMTAIIKASPILRTLHVVGCIDNNHINSIAKNCRQLTSLQTSNQNLEDQTIITLAANCTQLTHLSLVNCSGMSEQVIFSLANNCVQLKYVNIMVTNRTANLAKLLLSKCSKLRQKNIHIAEGPKGVLSMWHATMSSFFK